MRSGFIILDKPSGMTSRRAGAICAKIFGTRTFGHIGTLDPMASGLLIIAIGDATKMIPYITAKCRKKQYLFSVKFGISTDTDDTTGKVLQKCEKIPSFDEVLNVIPGFIGDILQIPPKFSAIHVDGKRAYDLARIGADFDMTPRSVSIYDLSYDTDLDEFNVVCSGGTYVRSLGRDIAEKCGSLGAVSMIRRIQTDGVFIKDSVKLDFLENVYNNNPRDAEKYLYSPDFLLDDIPVLNLSDNDAKLFKNGVFLTGRDNGANGQRRVYSNNKFIGMAILDNFVLKPKRIINVD